MKFTYSVIAGNYKISKGQITRLEKESDYYHALKASGARMTSKNRYPLRNPMLEEKVYKFVGWIREERLLVSGHILKNVATNFAQELGLHGFKASPGWVARFQRPTLYKTRLSCSVRSLIYSRPFSIET